MKIKLPWPAFGTGTALFSKDSSTSVANALKAGFRHIDTAEGYDNEKETGKGILDSKIPLNQIFVTSKILKNANDPHTALSQTLKNLNLPKLSLYLLHSPILEMPLSVNSVWRNLESLKDSGLVSDIGVSNFRISDLKELLKHAQHPPAVNQIEVHPYVWKRIRPLVEYCNENDIQVFAYGSLVPITRFPKDQDNPVGKVVSKISTETGLSDSQVLLLWSVQKGALPVTTSSNHQRIRDILELPNLRLAQHYMDLIDHAGETRHFRHQWAIPMTHMDKD